MVQESELPDQGVKEAAHMTQTRWWRMSHQHNQISHTDFALSRWRVKHRLMTKVRYAPLWGKSPDNQKFL